MVAELVLLCAPAVAPATIHEIIRVESGGNPIAINVNGLGQRVRARDADHAAQLAHHYIAAGHSVDMGLMQINSTNLARLGYSVEEMFNEPCKNIAAGAAVLTNFYRGAKARHPDPQTALRAALSAYNTGSFTKGFANGYVGKYTGQTYGGQTYAIQQHHAAPARQGFNPYTAGTAVFIRQEQPMSDTSTTTHRPVLSADLNDAATPGVQVAVDADTAESVGAFEETAMSEADAWDSNADLADPHATGIVVKGQPVGFTAPRQAVNDAASPGTAQEDGHAD